MQIKKLIGSLLIFAFIFPAILKADEVMINGVFVPVVNLDEEPSSNPVPPPVQNSGLPFLISSDDDNPISIVQEGDNYTITSTGNVTIQNPSPNQEFMIYSGSIASGNANLNITPVSNVSGTISVISSGASIVQGGFLMISTFQPVTQTSSPAVTSGGTIAVSGSIVVQPAVTAPAPKAKKEKPAKTEAAAAVKGDKVVKVSEDKKNKK